MQGGTTQPTPRHRGGRGGTTQAHTRTAPPHREGEATHNHATPHHRGGGKQPTTTPHHRGGGGWGAEPLDCRRAIAWGSKHIWFPSLPAFHAAQGHAARRLRLHHRACADDIFSSNSREGVRQRERERERGKGREGVTWLDAQSVADISVGLQGANILVRPLRAIYLSYKYKRTTDGRSFHVKALL